MKKFLVTLFIIGGVIATSTLSSHAVAPVIQEITATQTLMSYTAISNISYDQMKFDYSVACQRGTGYAYDWGDNTSRVNTQYWYSNHISLGYVMPAYKLLTHHVTITSNGISRVY